MADLQEWIGRTTELVDEIGASQARGLAVLLDRELSPAEQRGVVPPGWHWIYFRPTTRRSELGEDGHARRGGFLPPIELPRRMWVGGRVRFLRALPLGVPAKRRSTIQAIESRSGRSGELVFVTVRHEILTGRGVAIDEEQDLVYRSAPAPGQAIRADPAPADSAWSEEFTADEVALFRFSALTFNGHRIHFDQPYATGVEGYPGLVVHGPLTALLVLDAAQRHGSGEATPCGYEYKAVSPLFAGERITLAGSAREGLTMRAWAAGPRGLAMTATVEWDQ